MDARDSTEPDDFAVELVDGHLVVRGEVDAMTAPRLAEAIDGHDGDVVLDMSETDFIDSSGIRILVQQHQARTGAGHTFRIAQPSRAVLRTLELSALDTYFDIV